MYVYIYIYKIHIYVFQVFFYFFNFQATCRCFQILRGNFFHSPLNLKQKQPACLASQCTNFLLHIKPVKRNYLHSFKDFKPKSTLCRLIRLRLPVKMLLMEIIFQLKVIINKETTKKLWFWQFYRIFTRALTLTPRNTYIYGFRAFFGFINFQAAC